MEISLDAFLRLLQPFSTWRDLLDVLLVALVLYNLLLLIRGTRAVQVVVGIVALVLIYFAARIVELPALERTLESFFTLLPVAILILFQHEIRRALASFGRAPLLGRRTPGELTHLLNDILLAATTLSDRKIGALVVFERRQGLRNYVENGTVIDAAVSTDLLISLFHPESPTHDGAVIIQHDRIAAATCFLPLTRRSEVSKELGTRHRAALGISEESDAVALVVSEETGQLSLAVGGEMHRRLTSATLMTLLLTYLVTESDSTETVP